MKSPFPGMDPFLEALWRDVHHRFLTYACDNLQQQLPDVLRARLEERVFIEPDVGDVRSVYPDLRVIEYPQRRGSAVSPDESNVAVAEPIIVHADPDETATEGYIEIVDVGTGKRVVTVIELLSAANKFPGDGQKKYLQKQREYLSGRVSLVEIDLLRGGDSVMAVPKNRVPMTHRTTYRVCVARGWKPKEFELYGIRLRDWLPIINVPLRERDNDARLNLQEMIGRCYLNGRYDDIDYSQNPIPALDASDAEWARQLIASRV